ncbi:MAG: T9SS C-terminal target domain-containing protein [Bacteroidetes bacterium]|nr:MAG: T9SS C-terminal target domain-containing protein [Bacteroidota bacterium]
MNTRTLFAWIFLGAGFFSFSSEWVPPPPGAVGAYFNGVFPETAPGGTWGLEDPLPEMTFMGPVRILAVPGSGDLLVLCKVGEIWRVDVNAGHRELVLDIKDRAFKKGDGGAVGMALHPRFGDPTAPDKQVIFVYYRTKPDPDEWSEKGFNRLSKFSWNAATGRFDPDSEVILIQQYDRMTWHNGGGMAFGKDGFLYLSVGDEGDENFIPEATQRLDGGFFSGILRLDVDNDPSRSHPIIRQPRPNADPPAGWGATFSQGYSIPNDNPWLSPDGSRLEEFYAIGLRSPYVLSYDEETDQFWVADVGSDKREEISRVGRAANLQWPYREGTFVSEEFSKPADLLGKETEPFFEYGRSEGNCIIGGGVYRGTAFPELNGKYLFADWGPDKLMALNNSSDPTAAKLEILINNIANEPVQVPEKPGITGVFSLPNGEIWLTVMGENAFEPGKIFRLIRRVAVPEPPVRLSELGVFLDLQNLTPAPGLIPYDVQSPLWSDRALKRRWMAIPNDGRYDSPEEQIRFSGFSEWRFPPGTVFVKHFELPLTTDPTGETAPLETRFWVVGKSGNGYGLTYKWNEAGTEAFLQGGGSSKEWVITEAGMPVFTQQWDYPGRDQCLRCHTPNAGFVLGVKTHQLNGDFFYPEIGQKQNQLSRLNDLGLFGQHIGDPDDYPRAYPIGDESVDLELRIRSYLDANCSNCHRLGGVDGVSLDFRFVMPPRLQNLINFPTQSHASDPARLIVEPGAHAASELWVRDASLNENRMPPLGRNLVDEPYIEALAEWIDQLPSDAGRVDELVLFPNPTGGWLNLRVSDAWAPPYESIIRSVSGRVCFQEKFEEKARQFDLTSLPAGVYFLEIAGGGNRETHRFIKR